ncbi:MATE family efflux transporter [Sphingomonas sp. NSE70-1]|uniref:MATE family efflux transporter n=1 Tax=Sphingomonas caseinilyticus TaxID=2908205 RepID=A0ABT0RTH6_9SPHN|nr:MATE family efflux transporter [Sphingomonas caseinilyticus]MCL6698153.1 MATE family efflux transporter [Sphingomonas caseinilyticus]
MADAGAKSAGRGDLTHGSIGPTLLRFALPTLASSILQSLNGTINAIWVGQFLGEDALAATSNANIVMFLLTAFVFGFGMASTILIGQSWGRRDLDGARRIFGTAGGAFLFVTILIAAAGYGWSGSILALLGTPAGAAPLALDYLQVIFLAMPALLLLTLLMMALRGSGDSMSPLWFMIVAVVLDSGLNPVFILGLGPAPEMGIAGSATATLIANYTALIGMIIYLYLKDLPLRLRGKELRYLLPSGEILKTIVAKGLPMGIQMIVISLSALALIGFVNREGVDTAAAFGVAMQLWTYVQMPAMALGAAVSAMAAQNIGANKWDRVGQITRSGVIYTVAITAVLIVVLTLSDNAVLGLFMGSDSPALPIARHIHMLATWNFLLFGVTMVLFGTVRANGAVWGPLAILCVGLVPIRFGFIFAGYPALDADAIWLSFPVSSAVNLLLAAAFYAHGGWRKAHMRVEDRPSEEECVEEAHTTREPGGALSPAG